MKTISESEIIFLLDVLRETVSTNDVPEEIEDECIPMLTSLLESEDQLVA